MRDELKGIEEKIKRTNECIGNLNREIKTFFDQSRYPIIPSQDDKMFQVVSEYHLSRPVPLRFSVLAGEIVHHLRSSLDHLIWQLSSDVYRINNCDKIEFPIYEKRPVGKNEISRYERKIEGIPGPAKALIEGLQPYKGPHPRHSPLFTIHEMDRFDKHRELVIVVPVLGSKRSIDSLRAFMDYKKAEGDGGTIDLKTAVEMDSKIAPHVTFREFGGRKYESVVPGLQELVGCTEITISEFERFFP